MPSEIKIASNRANAKKSTGPNTELGKVHSSRNSLKLGLHSKSRVLPGESEPQYKRFADAMIQDLKPQGAVDEFLADQFIGEATRVRLFERVEKFLLTRAAFRAAQERADALGVEAIASEADSLSALLEAISDGTFLLNCDRLRHSTQRRMMRHLEELRQRQENRLLIEVRAHEPSLVEPATPNNDRPIKRGKPTAQKTIRRQRQRVPVHGVESGVNEATLEALPLTKSSKVLAGDVRSPAGNSRGDPVSTLAPNIVADKQAIVPAENAARIAAGFGADTFEG